MQTLEATAARMVIQSLLFFRGMLEHAHRRGQRQVRFPDMPDPLELSAADAHIRARLADPHVKPFATAADREKLGGKLGRDWSWNEERDAVWEVDVIETLAWTIGLRNQIPPWDGSVNAAVSIVPLVMACTVPDLISGAAARPEPEIVEARQQAAAWRWRAWAHYYQSNMPDLAPSLQPKAKQVVKQIRDITALCAKRKWFKPVGDDFPVAGAPYGRMFYEEARIVEWVSNCRNWALQFAVSSAKNGWDDVHELTPDECLAIFKADAAVGGAAEPAGSTAGKHNGNRPTPKKASSKPVK